MSQAPVSAGIDAESLRAFNEALRRYALATRKTAEAACKRQMRNVLIKARTGMYRANPGDIPDFADGSPDHCRMVAWRLMARAGRTVERRRNGQWVAYRRTRSASGRTRRRDGDLLRSGRAHYSREYARRYAEKMTRVRLRRVGFGRVLFTRAMRAIGVKKAGHGATATVAYDFGYKAGLTAALKPRAASAREYQRVIDGVLSAALRAAERDMADYIGRRLAGQWR